MFLTTPTKSNSLQRIGCLLLFLLLGKAVQSQKQEQQQQQQQQALLVGRRLRSNRDTNIIGRAVGSVLGLLPLDDILAPGSTIAELEATRKKQEEEEEGQIVGGGNLASTLDDVQVLTCSRDDACTNDSWLEGGTKGSWVCRNNLLAPFSVCIPSVLGVTAGKTDDSCGCCNGNCPVKCQCGCGDDDNSNNSKNVLTHWNLLFGLLKFEQCLDPTVAGAATTFSTFDISCSTSCLVEEEEGTTLSDDVTEDTDGNDVTQSSSAVTDSSQ